MRISARTTVSPLPGNRPAEAAGPEPSRAPVIVLALAYSGASTLRSLLEGHPELACTSGTGLIPLCEQAMATWSYADDRPSGTPSSLASTTTRALVSSVITAILVREGKRRWCEVAAVNPRAADTFLHLYPGTRFLCLYRACPGVIRTVLDASPWGITDPVFTPFSIRYPANTIASLTAYWVNATRTLLEFEREHSRSCLRVRYEDIDRDRQSAEKITSFLGLAETTGRLSPVRREESYQASPGTTPQVDLPVSLLPPALLSQANDLLQQLGYPLIAAG